MEELDLKELFNIFWERKLEIVIILLVAIVVGTIYSYFIVKPVYTSYTTLLLKQANGEKGEVDSITQTDLTLISNLISTYSKLITSKSVVREVLDSLSVGDLTEEQLKRSINVSKVEDAEMIRISVTNENPNYAEAIANKVAEVFSEQITDIYKIDNVYIVDKAEADNVPSNINHTKDLVIFAFVGVVIACGYALLINMLDNTVKTEADIEKLTGLKVLAAIPNYDTEAKGGKRK